MFCACQNRRRFYLENARWRRLGQAHWRMNKSCPFHIFKTKCSDGLMIFPPLQKPVIHNGRPHRLYKQAQRSDFWPFQIKSDATDPVQEPTGPGFAILPGIPSKFEACPDQVRALPFDLNSSREWRLGILCFEGFKIPGIPWVNWLQPIRTKRSSFHWRDRCTFPASWITPRPC